MGCCRGGFDGIPDGCKAVRGRHRWVVSSAISFRHLCGSRGYWERGQECCIVVVSFPLVTNMTYITCVVITRVLKRFQRLNIPPKT